MQHTETYNLNLIETSDTFSPDPLNQNAQLLEGAVEAEAAARTAADSALSQRVTVLEARRLVAGVFAGNGTSQVIQLGFTPRAVLVLDKRVGAACQALAVGTDSAYYDNVNTAIKIVDGGFETRNYSNHFNTQGSQYHFIAFL